MLSPTVLAKQHGISKREYLRMTRPRKILRIPYPDNPRYELRAKYERAANGKWKLFWRAYYLGKHAYMTPVEVHEIYKSTNKNDVMTDLTDLLREADAYVTSS